MITSLKSIARNAYVTTHVVRKALIRFENLGFLVNVSATSNRKITICNWVSYQVREETQDKQWRKQSAKPGQRERNHGASNKNDKE